MYKVLGSVQTMVFSVMEWHNVLSSRGLNLSLSIKLELTETKDEVDKKNKKNKRPTTNALAKPRQEITANGL